MHIISVTPNEVGLVAPLFDQYRVFYRQPSDPALAQAFIAERVANRESVIFLALQDGEPVGFTQLYPSFSSVSARRTWILNDLYVVPSCRGQGVGSALLERARAHAQATGAKGLGLQTAVDNLNAQRLYEALGYRREEGFYSYFLAV
ncbi:GNAT family N-acetyltransferase [Pseudomonas flexibilis]|uniref:Acetyltransferase n=1 Tax=Pseudomonas flexibilis TaxID=706570 RepID=A0A0B2D7P7_9PSED|nr:GNAT family N-acetyltransferase [Pseudomonas flexibilis]KHL70658.1 putative Acyl-CoA N-acyltransferase [Pseudomonas flexibilis]KHO66169.1 acetyltransferase [Pseudomonas flexibilis]SCY45370.1 Acetyltransferase (GNAT) family protein [Pseudomonas flexibilis]SIR13804.1 Acetyltransferase (GNAT) family protein [Pseudomonas flexibilis]